MADEQNDVLSFLDDAPVNEGAAKTVEAPAEGIKPVEGAAAAVEAPKPVEGAKPAEAKVEGAPAPKVEEAKTVPLATFLDTLNENRELKKAAKPTPVADVQFEIPDPVKNPAEYAQYRETVSEFELMNERMNNSERFARLKSTDAVVDKAKEWALPLMDTNPEFSKRIVNSVDPYSEVVKAHAEHVELEEYRAWVAGGKKPPADASKPEDKVPAKVAEVVVIKDGTPKVQQVVETVPSSIVDDVSAGGAQAAIAREGAAFDTAFGAAD